MKKLLLNSILAVYIAVLSSACSARKEIHSDDYMIVPNSWTISQASLSCAYGSQCDGSIGVLFSLAKAQDKSIQLRRCTAWFIASDVIATNSHCVNFQQQGSLSYTWFKLPDNSPMLGRYVAVRSVIQASPKGESLAHVDYAYLQLDQAVDKAPVITIDQSGIKQDELLDIHVVNSKESFRGTDDEGLYWQLDSFQCRASSSTMFMKEYDYDPAYHVVTLVGAVAEKPCYSIGGNSGSPVLSQNGQAKGIVYLGLNEEGAQERLEKMFQAISLKYQPHGSYMSQSSRKFNFVGVSNFACIPSLHGGVLSKDCHTQPLSTGSEKKESSLQRMTELFRRRYLKNEAKKIESLEVVRNGFRWKSKLEISFENERGEFVQLMTPVCFVPSHWYVKPEVKETDPSMKKEYIRGYDSWDFNSRNRDIWAKYPVELNSESSFNLWIRKPMQAIYDQNLEVSLHEKPSMEWTGWGDYSFQFNFELSQQRELKSITLRHQRFSLSSDSMIEMPSEIQLQPCGPSSP